MSSFQGLPLNMNFYPDQQINLQAGIATATAASAPTAAASKSKPEQKPKPAKRYCSFGGCKNGVVQGGVCVSHGAKRRKCRFPGCEKNSKQAGLCSKHGPPRKKCAKEACNNVAVRGGFCKSHGAPIIRCDVEGCTKIVAFSNKCRRHEDMLNAAGNEVVPGSTLSNNELGAGQFYPNLAQIRLSQAVAAQSMVLQGNMGIDVTSGLNPITAPVQLNPLVLQAMIPNYLGAIAAMGQNGALPIGNVVSNGSIQQEQGQENETQEESQAEPW